MKGIVPPTAWLSVEENNQLVLKAAWKIFSTVEACRLPLAVEATAISLLKRFYLVHSALVLDPEHLAPSALMLACKLEECHAPVDMLCMKGKWTSESMFKHEITLLNGINFHATVYSPFRALIGWATQMREETRPLLIEGSIFSGDESKIDAFLGDFLEEVSEVLQCWWLCTDASFLASPQLLTYVAIQTLWKRKQASMDDGLPPLPGIVPTTPPAEREALLLLAATWPSSLSAISAPNATAAAAKTETATCMEETLRVCSFPDHCSSSPLHKWWLARQEKVAERQRTEKIRMQRFKDEENRKMLFGMALDVL